MLRFKRKRALGGISGVRISAEGGGGRMACGVAERHALVRLWTMA